jgi:4-amino-4-deoxy-L-arabinose transferase-like glycosyltransferase
MTERKATQLFFAAAIGLTLARLAALAVSHADLGPDEAQYWFWSRELAAGYYSKPPLIAWAIAASTALFGDAAWTVRLPAPLFHLGGACLLFAAIAGIASRRAAAIGGLLWLTLPGVFLSAALMTTDAPLLFFWSAALFFLLRFAKGGGLADAAGVGAAIGFGLLAKYAMIYFPIGVALCALLEPAFRARMRPPAILAMTATALAIYAPNLAWNAAHDFQTLSHTADNANWTGAALHPVAFARFIAGQAGIVGPILIVILALAARDALRGADATARLLVLMSLSPLAIIAVQSMISRAHANWAATAYPGLIAAMALWALASPRRLRAIGVAIALNAAIGAGFLASFASVEAAGLFGARAAYKSLTGWSEIGAGVARAGAGADAIVVDDRELMAELLYYAKGAPPLYALNSNGRIDNHFEAFRAFDPAQARTVLFASTGPSPAAIEAGFTDIAAAGTIEARSKPGARRVIYLYTARVGDQR